MTPDYYAALGLSPTSEDVVIRAAYKALMRRYHPDGNPSADAAARTRAINAAYAVLGDPDRRAEYDQSRAAGSWVEIPARPLSGLPSGLFAAAAMLLVLVVAAGRVVAAADARPAGPAGPAARRMARADPPNPRILSPAEGQPPAARPEPPVPNVHLARPIAGIDRPRLRTRRPASADRAAPRHPGSRR